MEIMVWEWSYLDWYVVINILEELDVVIIRVGTKNRFLQVVTCLQDCMMVLISLVNSCHPFRGTLCPIRAVEMVVADSSEVLIPVYKTTCWCHLVG